MFEIPEYHNSDCPYTDLKGKARHLFIEKREHEAILWLEVPKDNGYDVKEEIIARNGNVIAVRSKRCYFAHASFKNYTLVHVSDLGNQRIKVTVLGDVDEFKKDFPFAELIRTVKITDTEIKYIKLALERGLFNINGRGTSLTELANDLGVHVSTVSRNIRRALSKFLLAFS